MPLQIWRIILQNDMLMMRLVSVESRQVFQLKPGTVFANNSYWQWDASYLLNQYIVIHPPPPACHNNITMIISTHSQLNGKHFNSYKCYKTYHQHTKMWFSFNLVIQICHSAFKTIFTPIPFDCFQKLYKTTFENCSIDLTFRVLFSFYLL